MKRLMRSCAWVVSLCSFACAAHAQQVPHSAVPQDELSALFTDEWSANEQLRVISSDTQAAQLALLTQAPAPTAPPPPPPAGELSAWPTNQPRAYSDYYFRASLLGVNPVSDATAISNGNRIKTNSGFGLSVATGYKMPSAPLSWELEYMYRRFTHDAFVDPVAGNVSKNDVSLHTLALNVMFDQPNIIGPVGLYAGGGAGVRLSSFAFSSSSGGASSSITGEGLFLQAIAGVTISLQNNVQLGAGVRYTDSGTIGNNTLDIDTASFGIEAWLRVYY